MTSWAGSSLCPRSERSGSFGLPRQNPKCSSSNSLCWTRVLGEGVFILSVCSWPCQKKVSWVPPWLTPHVPTHCTGHLGLACFCFPEVSWTLSLTQPPPPHKLNFSVTASSKISGQEESWVFSLFERLEEYCSKQAVCQEILTFHIWFSPFWLFSVSKGEHTSIFSETKKTSDLPVGSVCRLRSRPRVWHRHMDLLGGLFIHFDDCRALPVQTRSHTQARSTNQIVRKCLRWLTYSKGKPWWIRHNITNSFIILQKLYRGI